MPTSEPPEWHCTRCGDSRWVGWRAGPAHEGFRRFAQCVPCGKVQDLPTPQPEEQTVTNPTGPDDPGAQDECATCGHARWRHKELDGVHVCTEYVDCACGGHFVELSPATRMARVITAAGDLAHEFAGFRATLQTTLQSLHRLHTAMRVAGLLPEDGQTADTEDTPGRHAAIEEARQVAAEQLSQALDVPEALITGPSPDGLPDHWATVAGKTSTMAESCPTCWPRPCDPTRSLCRRNPDVTQAMPQVADQDQGEPPQDTGHMGTHQTIPHAPGRGPIRYDAPAPARGPRQPDADQSPQEHEHGPACVRHGCPNPDDQDATR